MAKSGSITKTTLTSIFDAARRSGWAHVRVEFDGRKIVVVAGQAPIAPSDDLDLDRELAENEARNGQG